MTAAAVAEAAAAAASTTLPLGKKDDGESPIAPPTVVAIVGAGFAGLALANLLQHHKIPFQLLEAKSEYIPIVGNICLPLAKQLWQVLTINVEKTRPADDALSSLFSSSTCADDDNAQTNKNYYNYYHNDNLIPQELFLQSLRQRVKIHYSCCINQIVWDDPKENNGSSSSSSSRCCCHLITRTGETFGPFHTIVAADGLFGAMTQLLRSSAGTNQIMQQRKVAIIGDARWQYQVPFWDFGQRRRSRGGDMALADAMELSQIIIASHKHNQNPITPNNNNNHHPQDTNTANDSEALMTACSKFHPRFQLNAQRTMMLGNLFVILVVMAIAIAASSLRGTLQ